MYHLCEGNGNHYFPLQKALIAYGIWPSQDRKNPRAGMDTVLFVLFCLFWPRKTNGISSKWETSAHFIWQKTMPNPEAHLEGPLTMVPGAKVNASLVLGTMWRRHWEHNFSGKTSDQLDLRFPTEVITLQLLSWVYYMTEKSTSTLLRSWYFGVS